MKKQTLLLSALALSIGLSLSVLPPAAASLPTQVPGQGALPSLAPMLEKVLPAVVSVQVEGTASPTLNMPEELKKYFGDNAPQEQAQPFEGLGSGVIIDAAKGYVLTNNHVINQAQKISVQLNDGREFDAKLVGSDEQSDIALLQLIKPDHLTQIAIADSDKLRVGDFAVAVGNPFGLGQTATSGIISALGRSGLNLEGLENFIQTDASINRGNSGGALVNEYGQVIGINSSKIASTDYEGMAFSVPSVTAKEVYDEIVANGYVTNRPKLGITYSPASSSQMYSMIVSLKELPAGSLIVQSVQSDSSLASQDVKQGDLITKVNGKDLDSADDLPDLIDKSAVGDTLTLTICRIDSNYNINEFEVKATLVEDKGDSSSVKTESTTRSNSYNPFSAYGYGN